MCSGYSLCMPQIYEPVLTLKVCSVSPRRHHVLFSTQDPPTIQSMPWPIGNDDDDHEVAARAQFAYETWLLNDQDFEWLVETDGKPPDMLLNGVLNAEQDCSSCHSDRPLKGIGWRNMDNFRRKMLPCWPP